MPLLKVTNRYSAWQRESALRITEVHAPSLVVIPNRLLLAVEESLWTPMLVARAEDAHLIAPGSHQDCYLQFLPQIPPRGIHISNEGNLLLPPPLLDLLLAGDGVQYIGKCFEVNESINRIARSEALIASDRVLGRTPLHVVADANVERSRETRQNVDKENSAGGSHAPPFSRP